MFVGTLLVDVAAEIEGQGGSILISPGVILISVSGRAILISASGNLCRCRLIAVGRPGPLARAEDSKLQLLWYEPMTTVAASLSIVNLHLSPFHSHNTANLHVKLGILARQGFKFELYRQALPHCLFSVVTKGREWMRETQP